VAVRWQAEERRPSQEPPALDVLRPSTIVPAYPFELGDLDARPVRLADFRGRVVLLNFWATWCPPCRKELPALEEVARAFAAEGLTVLTVSVREPADTVRTFVQEVGLGLPVLLDDDGVVSDRYGVLAIPTTVVVDRRGRAVGRIIGYRDWVGAQAQEYLRAVLREREGDAT